MRAERRRQRLIILDDQAMMVEALRMRLASEYDVLGVAYSGAQLLRWLTEHTADCLLLELAIAGEDGLHLIANIRSLRPDLKILVVTFLRDVLWPKRPSAPARMGSFPR